MTATSDRQTARLPIQSMGERIAEYLRVRRRDNHGTLRAQIVLLRALSVSVPLCRQLSDALKF